MKRLSNWGFSKLILPILALVFMLFSGANAFEAQTSDKNMVRQSRREAVSTHCGGKGDLSGFAKYSLCRIEL